MTLQRAHGYCQQCQLPSLPVDELIGLDSFLTVHAARMATLAGIDEPFRKARRVLEELCGWQVSAETIRQICHEHARKAREKRPTLTALPQAFDQSTDPDHEIHIDAGKVNTPEGWRDIKVAVFASRARCENGSVDDYEQRNLPSPGLRSVVAQVETASDFGQRCAREASRLQIGALSTAVSVLGDGAEWIWNLAWEHFADATEVLDVYHGVEKLAEWGREAFGRSPEVLSGWLASARGKLLGDGYWGVCESLRICENLQEKADAVCYEKTASVLGYFSEHQDRLGYAARLLRGQTIGSGLVEGTIKQRVNLRLKRGSARWLPEHAGPLVELMAMSDTAEWDELWTDMAA